MLINQYTINVHWAFLLGIIEYWTGPKHEYKFPKTVNFGSKLDTDLYDFVKNKTYPTALAFSPDGKKMASISLDRKVR